MKRLVCIPVEFDGELYEFKLYAQPLLVAGEKLKVEYTEKICKEPICTFYCEYLKGEIEVGMKKEAEDFKSRTHKAITSWEEKQIEDDDSKIEIETAMALGYPVEYPDPNGS